MKCKIPEISWHNRDPVLSVDIQPKSECLANNSNSEAVEVYRLASGGTDSHVLIWYLNLNTETGDLNMDLAADLTRHQRAVNVVKWSPNGQLLASGDDESAIFIWKQKTDTETLNIMENTNAEDKEIWLTMKILRGHMEDVYDLSWAPNSQLLVSGSVDNTAMIWDVHKGKSLAILNDHKGFVQGVAWDPRNQYIATLSTDRYLRIFDIQTRKVLHRINKTLMPVPPEHELHEKRCRLYHDDTLQTFFRRLSFTPDGKLLITPAGVAEYEDATHPFHTSYIFSRHAWKQPAIVLPSPEQYTVAVGCCPLLFQLHPYNEDNPPVVPLPYRMIFAVATRCSVYFYDTQQHPPFAVISNIHYTRLTDITWSPDGRIVVVSSTDGFCSLITFDEGELGEEYAETVTDLLEREQLLKNNNNNLNSNNLLHKKKHNNNKTNRTANEQQKSPKQKKQEQEEEQTKNSINIVVPEIILDKEILSSAEKFNTPAKKVSNATPIAIRRHPRPVTELSETQQQQNKNNKEQSVEVNCTESKQEEEAVTASDVRVNCESKDKMDIDEDCESEMVGRVSKEEKKVASPSKMEVDEVTGIEEKQKPTDLVEEAEKAEANKDLVEGKKEEAENGAVKMEEDLKKVVADSEETNKNEKAEEEKKEKENAANCIAEQLNSPEPKIMQNKIEQISADKSKTDAVISRANYLSPSERTPRRVALRTISTPKSKKKLLD